MGKIINIDSLLPDGIVFHVGEQSYRVRGDVTARVAFKLMALGKTIDAARDGDDFEGYVQANEELHDYLLGLFRESDPKLVELPWNFEVMARVASIITMRAMGVGEDDLVKMGDPPKKSRPPSQPKPRRSTTTSSTPRGGSATS